MSVKRKRYDERDDLSKWLQGKTGGTTTQTTQPTSQQKTQTTTPEKTTSSATSELQSWLQEKGAGTSTASTADSTSTYYRYMEEERKRKREREEREKSRSATYTGSNPFAKILDSGFSAMHRALDKTGFYDVADAKASAKDLDYYTRMYQDAQRTGSQKLVEMAKKGYDEAYKAGTQSEQSYQQKVTDFHNKQKAEYEAWQQQYNPGEYYGTRMSQGDIQRRLSDINRTIQYQQRSKDAAEAVVRQSMYDSGYAGGGYDAEMENYTSENNRLSALKEEQARYEAALRYSKDAQAEETGRKYSIDTMGRDEFYRKARAGKARYEADEKAAADRRTDAVLEIADGREDFVINSDEYRKIVNAAGGFSLARDDTTDWGYYDITKFYAMYDDDPESAKAWLRHMKTMRDEQEVQAFADQYGQEWTGRVGAFFMSPAISLASGLDPYGSWGQKASRIAEGMQKGVTEGLTEHGLFDTGALAGEAEIPLLGKVNLGTFAGIGMSMLQSGMVALPAMAIGDEYTAIQKTVEFLGTALMGSSAAASDYREKIKAGWSETDAMTHSLWAGLAEAGFEYISLDKLVDQDVTRGIIRNFFTQGGVEASEEFCTTVANRISDAVIARKNGYDTSIEDRAKELVAQGYSYDGALQEAKHEWYTELINDAFAGFVSGGGMTAMHHAAASVEQAAAKKGQRAEYARSMQGTEGAVEAIRKYAADRGLKEVKESKGSTRQDARQGKSMQAAEEDIAKRMQEAAEKGGVQGANQFYSELVEKYGDGIRSFADAALDSAVSSAVTATTEGRRANAYSVLAHQETVEGIQDERAREVARGAMERAAYMAAMQADDEAQWRRASDYRRNHGQEMTMQATVTNEDGSERQVGIESVDTEAGTVKLTGGETVSFDSLIADSDTKDVVHAMLASDMTEEASTKMIRTFQAQTAEGMVTDPYRWAMDYVTSYDRGRVGSFSLEKAQQSVDVLHADTVKIAYEAGQKVSAQLTQEKRDKLNAALAIREKGASGRAGSLDVGELAAKIEADEGLKAEVERIRKFAEVFGIDVGLFESGVKNGRYQGENGRYQDGKIWLDINAGRNKVGDVARGMVQTMAHEMTHFMQEYNPEDYAGVKRFVMQQIAAQKGENAIKELVAEKKKRHTGNKPLSTTLAEDEIVADFCADMLTDKAALETMAREDPKGFQALVQWIKDFMQKVFGKLAGRPAGSYEVQVYRSMEQRLRDAFGDAWGKGIVGAVQTHDVVGSLQEAEEVKPEGQNSDRDSFGRELSEGQKEYFKDSVIRDSKGRLMVLYHQTDADFTIFDPRHSGAGTSDNQTPFGIFLKSSSKDIGLRGKKQMALYANITNPLVAANRSELDEKLRGLSEEYAGLADEHKRIDDQYHQEYEDAESAWQEYLKEWRAKNPNASRTEVYNDSRFNELFEADGKILEQWHKATSELEARTKEVITSALEQAGYDGVVIQTDEGSFGRKTDTYIALHSEQVKNVDNQNPTENPDIRKQDRDAEYLELAKDPQKNAARLQEMVDEAARRAGYTIRAQHGSFSDQRFTVFKPGERGEMWFGSPGTAYQRPQMYDTYLKMDNPYEVTYTVGADTKFDPQDVVEKGRQNGHDGGIVHFRLDSEMVKKNLPIIEKLFPDISATSDFVESFRFMPQGDLLNTLAKPGETMVDFMKRGMEGDLYQWYTVYKPSQIKSSDPVTYDDAGKPIPLSQRFDPENEDIRYSRRTTPDEGQVSMFEAGSPVYQQQSESPYKGLVDDYNGLIDQLRQTGKWNGRELSKWLEQEQFDFIGRLANKDTQSAARKDLRDFLSNFTDEETLHMMRWVIPNHIIYGESRYEGAKKDFVEEVDKRSAEVAQGRVIDLKRQKATVTYVKNLFTELNKDPGVAALAEKVFDVVEKLGVAFYVTDDPAPDYNLSRTRPGTGKADRSAHAWSYGGDIFYRISYFADPSYSDQSKASTILHEAIHACTTYAIQADEWKVSRLTTDSLTDAVRQLRAVYKEAKNTPGLMLDYGIKSANEFIAELANTNFRARLQKSNLLNRIINAICKLFGIERKSVKNQLDAASAVLDYMLEHYYSYGASEYYENAERTLSDWERKNDRARYSMRDNDAPSDIDIIEGLDESKADTPEGKALVKDAKRSASKIRELRKQLDELIRQNPQLQDSLESVKSQFSTTDRKLKTKGISGVSLGIMKELGAGDAKDNGVAKRITKVLTQVYQDALDQIDAGVDAGTVMDGIYNEGVMRIVDILARDATHSEKFGRHWETVPLGVFYGEEGRQALIDTVNAAVTYDFVTSRYRDAIQETAADEITERVEGRMQKKIDEVKAQNTKLSGQNRQMSEEITDLRKRNDDAQGHIEFLDEQLQEARKALKDTTKMTEAERKKAKRKADRLAAQLAAARKTAQAMKGMLERRMLVSEHEAEMNRVARERAKEQAAARKKQAALEADVAGYEHAQDLAGEALARSKQNAGGWERVADLTSKQVDRLMREKQRAIRKLEDQIAREERILQGVLKPPAIQKMLQDARETAAKEMAKHKDEVFARAKDRKKASELRKRIKNLSDEMKRRMTRPTDGAYVPASLYGSMTRLADVLDEFLAPNPGTKAAERYKAMLDQIRDLSAQYRDVQNLDDPTYASEYYEDIQSDIDAIERTLTTHEQVWQDQRTWIDRMTGDAKEGVWNLSTAELQHIYELMKSINFTMKNAAKTLSWNEGKSLYDAMRSVAEQQQALTPLEETGKHETSKRGRLLRKMSTMRAVEMMAGYQRDAALYQLMHGIEQGVVDSDSWVMNYDKAMQPLKNGKNELEYRKAISKKLDFGATTDRGTKVLMTKMQAIQILMTAEREAHNDKLVHLQKGGAVIRDKASGKSYTIQVTPELLSRIQDRMTEWDKAYMKTIREYFGREGRATNEVLYKLKHRVLQTEEYYVPYQVDKNYLETKLDSPDAAMSMWVKTPGSTNALAQKASQPVYIDGMDAVMGHHVREIANYIGLALAIRDFSKVYNGMLSQGDGENPLPVKETIYSNFGVDGQKLLTQAVIDIQGGRRGNQHRTGIGKFLEAMQSSFYKTALLINPSVTIKQAASYVAIESILDHRAVIAGNRPIFVQADKSWSPSLIAHLFAAPSGATAMRLYNEIDAHTSMHYMRRQGMSMRELASQANRSGPIARAKGMVGASMEQAGWIGHKARQAAEAISPLNWIQRMDVATTAAVWVACKEQAKLDGMEVGTDEYWQHVTELYERCLRETQPMYDDLHRNEYQKDREGLMSYLFPFRTVPIQNHGQLANAYENMRAARKSGDKARMKAANRFFRKTVAAQTMSAAVFSVMTFLAAALKRKTKKYRDDDEEISAETIGIGIGKDVVGTLISVFAPLFGSTIWDTGNNIYDSVRNGKNLRSYDSFSVGVVDLLNELESKTKDIATDVAGLIAGNDVDQSKFRDHVMAMVEAGAKCAGIPYTTIKTYSAGIMDNITDILEGRIPALNDEAADRTNAVNAGRYWKAWVAGDDAKMNTVLNEMIQNYLDDGKDEDKAQELTRNALGNAVMDRYTEGELDLQELSDYMEGTGLWDDEKRQDKLAGIIRDELQAGLRDEDEAIDLLTDLCGWDEDKAWKKAREWSAKAEHADDEDYSYGQYDEIDAAIDANQDIGALVKDMTDHGVKKDNITSHVKGYLIDRYAAGGVTETALKNQLARYCGITAKDDVEKILKDANSKKSYGVAYSSLDEEYRAGHISRTDLVRALKQYGGLSDKDANKKVRWYDLQKKYPDMDITEAWSNHYYDGTSKTQENGHQSASAAGMTVKQYVDAMKVLSKVSGTDANGDGKTDTNSKEIAYIAAIDAMNLTGAQKWALYYEVYKGANWKKIAKPKW